MFTLILLLTSSLLAQDLDCSLILKNAFESKSGVYLEADLIGTHHIDDLNKRKSLLKPVLDDFAKAIKSNDKKLLSDWIMTHERAAYAYKKLSTVLDSHPFFEKTYKVKGFNNELVTFSFEKESLNESLSLYYKPSYMTDEDWFDQTHHVRASMLINKDSPLSKTELAPSFIGDLTVEYTGKGEFKHILETKSHSFEINPSVLMNQVRQISKDFSGETHSFHVHVVSKISNADYKKHSRSFIRWYKHLNDYTLLKGFEEGLQPNQLMGIADLKLMLKSTKPTKNLNEPQYTTYNYKYLTVGLRQPDIYSTTKNTGNNTLIGLEFRDMTRNLDTLEKEINKAASSLANRVWENNQLGFKTPHIHFENTQARIKKICAEYGFDEFHFNQAMKASDYMMLIPFIKFEEHSYFNYQKSIQQTAGEETADRIFKARMKYIDEVNALLSEMKKLNPNKKSFEIDDEDLNIVSKMELTTWAKQARVSELFENY